MNAAYKKVCANKGAGGVDDVTVEELGDYIKENWEGIREQIRRGRFNLPYSIMEKIGKKSWKKFCGNYLENTKRI